MIHLWQRQMESNHHSRSQSPSHYRCAMPLYCVGNKRPASYHLLACNEQHLRPHGADNRNRTYKIARFELAASACCAMSALVLAAGIEPAILAASDLKSEMYSNSTTPACVWWEELVPTQLPRDQRERIYSPPRLPIRYLPVCKPTIYMSPWASGRRAQPDTARVFTNNCFLHNKLSIKRLWLLPDASRLNPGGLYRVTGATRQPLMREVVFSRAAYRGRTTPCEGVPFGRARMSIK